MIRTNDVSIQHQQSIRVQKANMWRNP